MGRAQTAAGPIGGVLFGFDTSVIDGAVNSIQPKFALDPVVFGFTLAIILIGCALGVWFAGQLVDVCQLQPCSSWTAFGMAYW